MGLGGWIGGPQFWGCEWVVMLIEVLGSYDLSFTASGSQPSSIAGGAGKDAGVGYGDCVFGI